MIRAMIMTDFMRLRQSLSLEVYTQHWTLRVEGNDIIRCNGHRSLMGRKTGVSDTERIVAYGCHKHILLRRRLHGPDLPFRRHQPDLSSTQGMPLLGEDLHGHQAV